MKDIYTQHKKNASLFHALPDAIVVTGGYCDWLILFLVRSYYGKEWVTVFRVLLFWIFFVAAQEMCGRDLCAFVKYQKSPGLH